MRQRLQEPEGFGSYEEICQWLEQLGVKAAYSTVHRLVYERLQARLKVSRAQHVKQSSEPRDAFKKELAQTLAMLVHICVVVLEWSGTVRFFCGDETRIGLKTGEGRKITAKGVKPIGQVQWQFEFTYLYGIVEPSSGELFCWEFSHLNTDCFQAYLILISRQFAGTIVIIQLDNGAFHKARRLKVAANIVLLFQPPYCPELNPIEQVWQHLKKRLRWQLPASLDGLRQLVKQWLDAIDRELIASIVGRQSILDALSVREFDVR